MRRLFLLTAALLLGACAHRADGEADDAALRRTVDATIPTLMARHGVPGMAVAVTVHGRRSFFYYGVASKAEGRPVTQDTLFELGSVSKTLTATLAAYAQARGQLDFSASASRYVPELAGSRFDGIPVLALGTYTAGGLPLQFPDDVTDAPRMFDYFRHWQPRFPVGAQRQYSNPSIGLFGLAAARSLGQPFDAAMERTLFPRFGLRSTYLQVPPERQGDYAQGYTQDDRPIRVAPGMFDAQAYGVKTTAPDMLRFVEANLGLGPALEPALRRAIAATHTGLVQVGGNLVQGLGWEMYDAPVSLERVLAGNSAQTALQPQPAVRLAVPRQGALFNKTGSTNGFGAYAVFVPAKEVGLVLLANKNVPIPERIQAAWAILHAVE
ncbi:MAG: beta-lactamase [Acidovorax sp.]